MINFLIAFLVIIGIAGLMASIIPVRKIAASDSLNRRHWQVLGGLIIFFVCGYLVFVVNIFSRPVASLDLVVALILAGGGIFVVMVTRISYLTIGDVKKITALERHRALHDPLTDLPNRSLLLEHIDNAINTADRDSSSFALINLDLDRFKEINDALGPHYGDYLLQLITSRLCRTVRGSDTVARIGGDEFAILLSDVDREGLIETCRKLRHAFERPFTIEGQSITINVSMGASFYPENGRDGELLMQRAEIAMYSCKESGQAFVIYSGRHDAFTFDNLMMVNRLREDMERNKSFEVYYQPKVRISDHTLVGVEALIRWQMSGKNRLLLPGEFIDLAEQSGLICNLSQLVIEKTFSQEAAWQEQGIDLPISINLSARDLRNSELVVLVRQLLEQSDLSPDRFLFEITERSMIQDSDNTHRIIYELHNLGINFSIDDFGTGYSSLSVLKQLPVKEIKIDKSFVLDMLVDNDDAAIVKSTINLAANLGLQVVAEGVESAGLAESLEKSGCEILQGHFLCPPLPADEMIAHCREKSILLPAA